MPVLRVEKMSPSIVIVLSVSVVILALGASVATVWPYPNFYGAYSISPNLCPRNVEQFDDYLCAGVDFRSFTEPEVPFSVVFGAISPLSRVIDFSLGFNLENTTDVKLKYKVYKIDNIGEINQGTGSDDDFIHDPYNHDKWVGWSYANNTSDAWKLLESGTYSKTSIRPHGRKSKMLWFYRKEGIDEDYYKLEVSSVVFSNPTAVSAITLGAVPGPKPYGITSIVLICLGMAIGAAAFIHTTWSIRNANISRVSKLPAIMQYSIWMAFCILIQFTPLSLAQYFNDTFGCLVLNNALEEVSMGISVLLLMLMCRETLVLKNANKKITKRYLTIFERKLPALLGGICSVVGSMFIIASRVDPILGRSFSTDTYIFLSIATTEYAAAIVILFMYFICIIKVGFPIEGGLCLIFSTSTLLEMLVIGFNIAYIIWNADTLTLSDAVKFISILSCALCVEATCPVPGDTRGHGINDDKDQHVAEQDGALLVFDGVTSSGSSSIDDDVNTNTSV